MAKILFVNPVVRQEDVPRHVPYGIALLAAIAIEEGHQVQVYDANAWRQGPDTMREVCRADDWEVIAMGGITTAYNSIKELMQICGEECPDALKVLGGGVLTSIPREMMSWLPDVDIGVIGEAFVTWPELLAEFDRGGNDWSGIAGLIYRTDDGFRFTMPRGLLEDLDSLPYPAWDLFPLEEVYFPNSVALASVEGMQATRRLDINASYGCSMICRYCYHLGIAGDMRYVEDENGDTQVEFDRPGTYTRDVRYHSPEYIVNMVRHVHEKYGVNFIGFLDENLMTMHRFSRETWLTEICRLWHEYGLAPEQKADGTMSGGVFWGGTSHASLCSREILQTMRKAGCSHLVYGYESFAPHVLKTIGKGATLKHNIQSFFWTLEAGIRPIPNLIFGFPNDDFQSIRDNMDAWVKYGIVVKPHFATPYPGSEWFTVYRGWIEEQYGGDLEAYIRDLGDASDISVVISHNFNAVELLGLRELMIKGKRRQIDEYEKVWRRNHNLPDGAPSTVFVDPVKSKAAAE